MAILWIVLEQILSVGLLFLVLIGATIFVSVKLYKWVWGELHAFAIVWGAGTFIVLIIVSVLYVTITNFIVNDVLRRPHRPPVVDASPIAALTDEQIGGVEEAIMRLSELGYIQNVQIRDVTEGWQASVHIYSTGWILGSQLRRHPPRLNIQIRNYRYEDGAIGYMRTTRNLNSQYYIYIQGDNNTEAVLIHPLMPVSASGLYLPSDERLIRSEIRIGNIYFELWEYRHWIRLNSNYSTQFIAALVEAMQELHSSEMAAYQDR